MEPSVLVELLEWAKHTCTHLLKDCSWPNGLEMWGHVHFPSICRIRGKLPAGLFFVKFCIICRSIDRSKQDTRRDPCHSLHSLCWPVGVPTCRVSLPKRRWRQLIKSILSCILIWWKSIRLCRYALAYCFQYLWNNSRVTFLLVPAG